MNVRIGIALGQWPRKDIQPEAIFDLVECFEGLDVDSLWMSDRLVSAALILEPITFLSYIAGRLPKLKFGTSALVLPTRNPVVLAKELATLDFLSHGRLFPAFGLGGDESKDLSAVGVSRKERAARADEMIALMRRLWTEENVTFDGKFYSVKDVTIMPRPWQKNGLPIWIGGRSQASSLSPGVCPCYLRQARLSGRWSTSRSCPGAQESETVGRGRRGVWKAIRLGSRYAHHQEFDPIRRGGTAS